MGLLRVSMAQGLAGDPGRFRLGKHSMFRKLSIRNLRAGIRGLAPFASFIPGGGFVSQMAGMAGDKPGAKGGTHAHPSKHGTKHPHAKPSHAHARASHKGGVGSKIGSAIADIGAQLIPLIPGGAIAGALQGTADRNASAALHAHLGLGGHRRRMNYMNIKAARRAGRRVSGAIRLLNSLKKSLPHVAHGGRVVKHKRGRKS